MSWTAFNFENQSHQMSSGKKNCKIVILLQYFIRYTYKIKMAATWRIDKLFFWTKLLSKAVFQNNRINLNAVLYKMILNDLNSVIIDHSKSPDPVWRVSL